MVVRLILFYGRRICGMERKFYSSTEFITKVIESIKYGHSMKFNWSKTAKM